MPFKFLTLEVADRVATLTVNRPEKLNALNDATIAELGQAIDQIREDDSIWGGSAPRARTHPPSPGWGRPSTKFARMIPSAARFSPAPDARSSRAPTSQSYRARL